MVKPPATRYSVKDCSEGAHAFDSASSPRLFLIRQTSATS